MSTTCVCLRSFLLRRRLGVVGADGRPVLGGKAREGLQILRGVDERFRRGVEAPGRLVDDSGVPVQTLSWSGCSKIDKAPPPPSPARHEGRG